MYYIVFTVYIYYDGQGDFETEINLILPINRENYVRAKNFYLKYTSIMPNRGDTVITHFSIYEKEIINIIDKHTTCQNFKSQTALHAEVQSVEIEQPVIKKEYLIAMCFNSIYQTDNILFVAESNDEIIRLIKNIPHYRKGLPKDLNSDDENLPYYIDDLKIVLIECESNRTKVSSNLDIKYFITAASELNINNFRCSSNYFWYHYSLDCAYGKFPDKMFEMDERIYPTLIDVLQKKFKTLDIYVTLECFETCLALFIILYYLIKKKINNTLVDNWTYANLF